MQREVSLPLVSVITPTWRRNDLLLKRCVPAVKEQDYRPVEHVIVSDGPDPVLTAWWDEGFDRNVVRYYELPEHSPDPNYGHYARAAGVERATGEYITYCDDDDSLRPAHCSLLAAALDADPEAGFAVSRMVSHHAHPTVVGWGPLACGNLGSPMIMHRRSTLKHGTWGPPSFTEDWDLVEKWLDAGVKYANVDAETSDVWPSVYRLRYARLHHLPGPCDVRTFVRDCVDRGGAGTGDRRPGVYVAAGEGLSVCDGSGGGAGAVPGWRAPAWPVVLGSVPTAGRAGPVRGHRL